MNPEEYKQALADEGVDHGEVCAVQRKSEEQRWRDVVNAAEGEQGEIYTVRGKSVVFNPAAVAAVFVRLNEVCWVVEYGSFFWWRASSGIWNPLSGEELIDRLRRWWVKSRGVLSAVLALEDVPLLSSSLEAEAVNRIKGMASRRDVLVGGLTVGGVDVMPLSDGDLWLADKPRFKSKFDPRIFVRSQRLGVAWGGSQSESSLEIEDDLFLPALGGDEEMVVALWDLVARCVLPRGYYPAINYLGGEPGAGKTTILNFVLELVGEAMCKELDFIELAGSAFAKGFFAEGRVLYADDIDSTALSGRGAYKLKSLTGGGLMQGRLPFAREKVNFRGDFQILLSSNKDQQIAVDEDFGAWERRFCVWKFQAYERKKTIEHYHRYLLKREGRGIIGRILDAVERLRGRRSSHLPIWRPPAMLREVDAMLNASDPVAEFFVEHLAKDKDGGVTKAALREGYCGYAREHRLPVLGQTEFSRKADAAMERKFGLKLRKDVPDAEGKMQRGWRGVSWMKTP